MSRREASIEVQCHWCTKTFARQASHAKRVQRHFCNNECRGEWQRTQVGTSARAYKGALAPMKCAQCDKEILSGPEKVKRNDHFFCSRGCYDQWRKTNLLGPSNPNWAEPVRTECATCNAPIERKKSRVGTTKRKVHFCSMPCKHQWMAEHLSGENNSLWRGGQSPNYHGPNWGRQKRAARKRDGYLCQACGIPQAENGKALDVHHIVPFKNFKYVAGENETYLQANDLANLVSLCHRCHVKVDAGSASFKTKAIGS